MSASLGADGIAKALGGCVRGTDGWWNAKCPAHADGKASLALKDTDDGSVAYKCMAECDSKAVGDALRARGLLLPEHKADEAKAKARRRIGRTYDYADEAGELLFQVVRYEPKDFRQRRPDPDAPGGWIWKLNGVRRVLYRLPELLAANPAQPVFVVEGEKDVDHLRTLGLVATTSPQGAGKWALSDRGALAGRDVVVLPDNDETGRKHAHEVARDLAGKAASVRVVKLPDLPNKGDVSDWLANGGTADGLLQLAAIAPKFGDDLAGKRPGFEPDTKANAESDQWNELLHRTDRGEARDIIHNVTIILRKDNRLAGRLRWNELSEAAEARDLPWRRGRGWSAWTEADDLTLADWCQKRRAYVKKPTCAAAVQLVARDTLHHPVRERLNALRWDGTSRLDGWLCTYLGASVEDGANAEDRSAADAKRRYVKKVGRAWMISAVARAYNPGCKVDHALILEGAQLAGKSTAAGILALDPALFADQIADLGTKDSAQDLCGKWIIEIAELDAMRRNEVERTKAFLSRSVDHYRPSYGARSEDRPRQCVFIGSTNSATYLRDETGNRRFWPVKVGKIDNDALQRDVEQLWAEAVVAYRAGEIWWLDEQTEKAAAEEQEERRIVDPWEDRIVAFCEGKASVTVPTILDHAIGMEADRQDPAAMSRAVRVLTAHGWKQIRRRNADGTRSRAYEPPAPAGPPKKPAGPPESVPGPAVPGAKESNVCAGGPGGPGGPTVNYAHMRTGARAHARPEVSRSGWVQADHPDHLPPWRNLDDWRLRLRDSQSRADRTAIILAWGEAAGGTVSTMGDVVRLNLPPDLPSCYTAKELQRLARDLDLMPKQEKSLSAVDPKPVLAPNADLIHLGVK